MFHVFTVSFLPVFTMEGPEGKLFKPLAYTKTFAMGVAAVLSITLIPVAMAFFIRERLLPERWSRARSALTISADTTRPTKQS